MATGSPDYDEIAEWVSRAIWAFDCLPNHLWVFRGLTWPFCITGCMARFEQRERFKELAAINDCYNLQAPLQVMETCWELRDQHLRDQHSVHWFHAMDSLGGHILLV
jgi:hypothetical protein